MAVKKSELYSTLWKSCDKLRGGMDASQYKDYVLVLVFMKYVSDRSKNAKNSLLEIPEGGGFADLVKLKGKANIGEGINTVISASDRPTFCSMIRRARRARGGFLLAGGSGGIRVPDLPRGKPSCRRPDRRAGCGPVGRAGCRAGPRAVRITYSSLCM